MKRYRFFDDTWLCAKAMQKWDVRENAAARGSEVRRHVVIKISLAIIS